MVNEVEKLQFSVSGLIFILKIDMLKINWGNNALK